MRKEVQINSYFSLPTDLAGEMRGWPEFVSGEEYSVDLQSAEGGECVTVRMVEEEGELPYVTVGGEGEGDGLLFRRVVGTVVYALAKHSDNLMIHRMDKA